jgi:hypothetical protein
MVSGADGRVKRAEEALRQHRADRTHDLLLEMERPAWALVEKWMAWAAQGEAIYRELVEVASRATQLIVATRVYGGDSRSVPNYEHQGHVLKLANQEPPLPLPRPFVEETEAERMSEKQMRDRVVLGALHPGLFDDVVEVTDTPDFVGGARIDPRQAERRPQPQSYPTAEPGGWTEYEIEDGAALLFPWIEDDRR